MGQPGKKTLQVGGGGFATAAILAPGIALAIFTLATINLTGLSIGSGEIGGLIGNLLFSLLIVSAWGALPSLVFGGLVLAAIQRIPWRGRPTTVVFTIGGVTAAGLYVLSGLGIAGLSPGATMLFAPWAAPEVWGPSMGREDWWLVASLLLSGAGAGLIYSAFAKRG